jgi:hypothetical protein
VILVTWDTPANGCRTRMRYERSAGRSGSIISRTTR